jgi:hypothetical protein
MNDRKSLQQLEMARRTLAILEQQAAGYTALTIPAHLQIELEEKRKEVAVLERQVASTLSMGAMSHLATLPPNPFTDVYPIRDATRFVGRVHDLRRLLTLLQGGSVSLMGVRKTGKSSLLWRLKEIWETNGKLVFGPLNCKGMLDYSDFFPELGKVIGIPTSDKRILRDALKAISGLLLLDEMDYMLKSGLTADDFVLFRAACAMNPMLKLVTVSRTHLRAIFPDAGYTSPAYNFLLPFTLGPLIELDARALLGHPWDVVAPVFDAETIDVLLALTGRHPFKLQRAAYHRYEAFGQSGYDWETAYRDEIAQIL